MTFSKKMLQVQHTTKYRNKLQISVDVLEQQQVCSD